MCISMLQMHVLMYKYMYIDYSVYNMYVQCIAMLQMHVLMYKYMYIDYSVYNMYVQYSVFVCYSIV